MIILFAIFILTILYMYIEASSFEVVVSDFSCNKPNLKILFMSDIHINLLKVPCEKIVNVISKQNPDIILLAGDFIESKADIPKFLDFLKKIKKNTPVYLTLGNHDHKAFLNAKDELSKFIQEIKKLVCNVLINDSVCIEKNNIKYNIIGIDDLKYKRHNIVKALKSCDSDASLNLAFTHNPDIIFEIPEKSIDYLFGGHFHGGQIWMPFKFEFRLLRHEKLAKMGVVKGLHNINGIKLYISKGLGNVLIPFRFFSKPEISIFLLNIT